MHLMTCCFLLFASKIPEFVTGSQFNLTGSSKFAHLGKSFTLTCEIFLSAELNVNAVKFYRNNTVCVAVGYIDNSCKTQITNHRYTYGCLSDKVFTLTIPGKNMTEDEQGILWRCESAKNPSYKSSELTLKIAIDVFNVSLIPNDNSLTIQEGVTKEVRCDVNSNALPSPNITWYLGSSEFGSIVEMYTSSINITGKRTDNTKTLQCRASNSNKPAMRAETLLNVEYKPEVISSTPSDYIVNEGDKATLECTLKDANPQTNISWKWFRVESPSNVLYNGPIYTIPNIMRNKTGSYSCAASNSIGTSEAYTVTVDIQYKPEVKSATKSPYKVKEGQTGTLGCTLTAANPNTSITWKWFNTNNPSNVLHGGSTYTIPGIHRNRSGLYNCTASNSVGTSVAATISVDVLYRPEVSSSSTLHSVIEGNNATLKCTLTNANPNTNITWRWSKADNPDIAIFDGPNYTIPNILRKRSGSYICIAINSVGMSEAAKTEVDVLYKPTIRVNKLRLRVNESDNAIIIGEIDSNPSADIAWYSESVLLKNESSVTNTTYQRDNTKCTDTRNFTIVASNIVERNVTAVVELIVNCKPQIYGKNITLGVTDTTGIEFSIKVIAYPEPDYEVRFENGTNNDQMISSITRNSVNNFTIRVNQTDVRNRDYGVYRLVLWNSYGNATVFVNVIPERKPDMPTIIDYICEVKRARIQWKSSFNGGDPQSFIVVVFHDNQIENKTDSISDQGKNEIHSTFVENLQSSTTYVFSVSTHNKHGFTLSENISCTTLKDEGINLPLTAGAAAAGGITFAIIVIVVVVMFRRYTKNEERPGKPQRLEDELIENRDTDDDGLKENILYVSADTRDFEKPEPAVYAAVDKKSQETKSKANVYADVNNGEQKFGEAALYSDVKPKKGFFKKDEKPKLGGKPKQRKGKKQKIKQEVADVYENSEDIAMTATVDNVYSNSDHKHQPEKGQRGYKNKDGLLYVEVNFDGQQGLDNPVIHGEDEKTDYATVEFPMSSSVHKASGGEEL